MRGIAVFRWANLCAVASDRVQSFSSRPVRSQYHEFAKKLKPLGGLNERHALAIVSAILKHASVDGKLRRPKCWRGTKRTDWLKLDQALRVFKAAQKIDPEFQVFLTTFCYAGVRLSEGLRLTVNQVESAESFAYIAETKKKTREESSCHQSSSKH